MERQAPARQRWGGIKAHASRWVHHTSRIKHQASHGRRTCDRTLRHVGEALWMTPRAHLLARTACSDAASSGAVLSPSRNAHSPRCHREHGGGLRTYSRALDASLLASPRLASPRTIDASTPARRPSTLGDGMRASAALAATRLTRRCPLPLSGCALALGSSLALTSAAPGTRGGASARPRARPARDQRACAALPAPARRGPCLPLFKLRGARLRPARSSACRPSTRRDRPERRQRRTRMPDTPLSRQHSALPAAGVVPLRRSSSAELGDALAGRALSPLARAAADAPAAAASPRLSSPLRTGTIRRSRARPLAREPSPLQPPRPPTAARSQSGVLGNFRPSTADRKRTTPATLDRRTRSPPPPLRRPLPAAP